MAALALPRDQDQARVFYSFVAGTGERAALADLAGLRIGASLRLRPALRPFRGFTVEIQTAEGRPLGWLPREEADALAAAGIEPADAGIRVVAMVPAFQRPRIQVELTLPAGVIA